MTARNPEPNERHTVYVPPPVSRALDEMRIATRQFSRSALIVNAIVEKADRDLPANWREIVGYKESPIAND